MGLDSIEILMKVEETFAIRIPNEDSQKIRTVGDLHNIVWALLKGSVNRSEMEKEVNYTIADIGGLEIDIISPDKKITDGLGID